jgi:hypothetical protein
VLVLNIVSWNLVVSLLPSSRFHNGIASWLCYFFCNVTISIAVAWNACSSFSPMCSRISNMKNETQQSHYKNDPQTHIHVIKNNLQQYKIYMFEKTWAKNVSSINFISTKYVKNKEY